MKKSKNNIIKIGIVVSRFNTNITESLLQCCLDELTANDLTHDNIEIFRVPGAYELPFFAGELARSKKFKAIIGLGCIIKGETSHNEHIANWVSTGLGMASIQHHVPIMFGILTPKNVAQAKKRSKPGPLNRGKEVAEAALEMIRLSQEVLR